MSQHDPTRPGTSLGQSGSDVRQHAQAAAGEGVGAAKSAGQTIRDEASNLAGTAKEHLESQAAAGKDEVADRIASIADRVQASAEDLRGSEAWLADLVGEGARRLGGLADSMKQNDLRSLLGTVQSFARNQPALFAGASVALGFAAARLAKASSERARQSGGYGDRYDDYSRRDYESEARRGMPASRPADRNDERYRSTSGTTTGTRTAGSEGEFSNAGHYSGAQTPRPQDEQPGAAGLDRAATADRWRSPDLPISEPAAGQSRIGGTGVTP